MGVAEMAVRGAELKTVGRYARRTWFSNLFLSVSRVKTQISLSALNFVSSTWITCSIGAVCWPAYLEGNGDDIGLVRVTNKWDDVGMPFW